MMLGSVKSLLLEVSRLSVPAVGASEGIPVKETPEHVHSMQRLGP